MAIAGQTEIQKSMPDRAKLAAMSERTVQVVQLLAPNKPGKSVISAQKKASMDWIDGLPELLQQTWGAGTYKVEVYEESGPEKDVWTVKVGSSAEEESPMNGNGTNGANGFRPPIDGGAGGPAPLVQLGHGYFYNEALGLLTTPQKQIIPWRQGDPWPTGLGPVPSPQQPYAQQQGWGQTPWGVPPGTPPWMAQQGWGGYPATTAPAADDGTKRELEAVREALRVSEARAQDAERRREADAAQARFEKALADQRAQTEAVLAELREARTAKPTGPDPAVAEMQRRLEESERRHAEDLRRREESEMRVRAEAETRDREARMREEMKVNNARFEQMLRELSAQPKTDPMMTMLLQVVTGQQSASAEAVKAIGESTRAQLENARSQLATSSMTPEKMIGFMETLSRTTQGTSGELNRNMIGMFNELFSMSQNMLRMQLEGAANAAGPAWLPVAQQGLEQIGKIAQVYAVTQARASAGGQQQQQRPQQQMQRPPQQQMQRPQVQQAPQQQQLPDPRAAAAAAVFGPVGPDGKPVGRTASDQVAAAMAGHPSVTPIQAPAAAAAPGPAAAPPPAQAAPPVAAAPPAEAPRGRRGGRRRADEGQQQQQPAEAGGAVAAAEGGAEAPADPFGAVPASQIPPDAIRQIVAEMDDETLFAEALTQINVLRNSVKEGMPLEEIVNAVLTSRQYFQSFGINPPCLELLNGGHVDVLVIRLLPEATPEMWQQVGDGIRVALRAEASGGQAPS